MGTAFWIRRFAFMFVIAFVITGGSQLLRGRAVEASLEHGLLWGLVSAAVFVGGRLYQSRRGRHCALCNDIAAAPGGEPPRAG
ncbi:hypothetical protein [Ramlibacter algicola]|uniref:Uncharacterized protein n=1 Tax=Ramlibacter algicola TaxID=2795217 RepID=A0A934PZW2_9BURK|nr:hypothetical protein [Ramlibacter algicola]MBK0392458.1 hypothetical protein [Ramlibacter algicola]